MNTKSNQTQQDCIFCNIAREGVSGSSCFWENDTHVAFLDIKPSKRGHTLVIPKDHSSSHLELDKESYMSLWESVRQVSQLLMKKLNPNVVSVVIEGLEVPHTHVHLIPLQHGEKLASFDHIEQDSDDLARLRLKLIEV